MNLTLDEVSQFAHVGWGYLAVTALKLAVHVPLPIAALVVIAAAAGKEYWDCHGLENLATSGGVEGSWIDFAFWALGAGLGCLVFIRG